MARRGRPKIRDAWLFSGGRPTAEARSLVTLMERGMPLSAVRDLIEIPPTLERQLVAYALEEPGIERVLRFRQRVAEEFERLASQIGKSLSPPARDLG